MIARLVKHIYVAFFASMSLVPALHAAPPLAKCYLIPWTMVYRASPHPEQVRLWADSRCTVDSEAQLARLKAILRLDRMRASPPDTRDLRLVVDFFRPDGSLESYASDGRNLMSTDFSHSRRVGAGFEREIDSFFRSCSPKSSNQSMERTATRFAFAFQGSKTSSLRAERGHGGRRSSHSR